MYLTCTYLHMTFYLFAVTFFRLGHRTFCCQCRCSLWYLYNHKESMSKQRSCLFETWTYADTKGYLGSQTGFWFTDCCSSQCSLWSWTLEGPVLDLKVLVCKYRTEGLIIPYFKGTSLVPICLIKETFRCLFLFYSKQV